jgi:hypothetical protein
MLLIELHSCMSGAIASPITNIGDDNVDLLVENDLDIVYSLTALATALPGSIVGVSHCDALQACVKHARLWLARVEESIHPVSYIIW